MKNKNRKNNKPNKQQENSYIIEQFKPDSKTKQFIILQKKSGAMNIETYQICIKTLENQIKSREKQRQSMQNTITALDRDLGIEIERNKSLRNELMYLAQTNQNIINELHKLQAAVMEKDNAIDKRIVADQGKKLYVEALEREKVGLEEEVKQKRVVIGQINGQLIRKDNQLKILLQSIKGYEDKSEQKQKQVAQLSSKLHNYEEECAKLNQKLVILANSHQKQRQQLVQKILKTQGSTSSIVSDLELKITQLKKQLQQAKQFYTNQVATLQFNKQSQVKQLTIRISSQQSKIITLEQQITHLKQQQKQLKLHYQVQIENNDKIVNTLINEINFLKQEKVQLTKKSSNKIEETAQQFLKMVLEQQQNEAKAKAAENAIRMLKEEVYRKDKEVFTLGKEIEKLNLQVQVASKESLEEKDTVLTKNQEIAELKRFIDNLQKLAYVADKEKQQLAKKTAKQINSFKHQNSQLSKKLQLTIKELQQLRITSSQLQQTNKFLTLQKHSTSSSLAQLQSLVKNHQYTIEKLQNMLEQTKRVVVDLNKLMKIKLGELESLEMSNNMFRMEKVQWIKKQQDYRKRIFEYKATISAGKKLNLNETFFMSKARRSVSEKDNNSNINNQRTHSMIITNTNQKEMMTTPYSYAQSAMRRKTMTAANISYKAKSFTNDDSTNNNNNFLGSQGSSGNQQSTQGILTIPLIPNAFKKPQIMRTKKKSFDFTEIPIEAPVIPVLIAIKKDEEKIMDLSFEGKNKVEKEQRVGWEGLSENVIEALKLDGETRSPISYWQSYSNRDIQAQKDQQANKLPVSQQLPLIPIQIQVKTSTEAFQQSDKQISTSTHHQTPTFKENPKPTIKARSQNMTPEVHIQSEEQNLPQQQQKQNGQENLAEGYQTLEKYQEKQKSMTIPKKISPINSSVLIRQDRLVEILKDEELTELTEQNECSSMNEVKVRDQSSVSHQQTGSLSNNEGDDSAEAQNTVEGINLLLDRINTQ